MIDSIPLMPLPYKPLKPLIRGFYPIASRLIKFFPTLNLELDEINSKLNGKEYLSGALLTFTAYTILIGFILVAWSYRLDLLSELYNRVLIITATFLISFFIFFYILLIPRWLRNKQKGELERHLLFATRHLMIQTTAGVPLFDALVSVSEEYEDENLDYGEISREFKRIVKEVRGGNELTFALEESAKRNASPYYRRIIWQLANSNKAGANVGSVLKNMVEFLSNEQRILIRQYGSQLNPLALFYMFTCVIAPTMGVVLLMIASTFVDLAINELLFIVIWISLLVFQIIFIGLIKSRRPKVAL